MKTAHLLAILMSASNSNHFSPNTLSFQMIQVLRNSSTSNKPVAICTDLRTHFDALRRPKLEELATFGTTAEILAFREEDQSEYYYGPCFVVKFLGRQRFRLLELFRKMNG